MLITSLNSFHLHINIVSLGFDFLSFLKVIVAK